MCTYGITDCAEFSVWLCRPGGTCLQTQTIYENNYDTKIFYTDIYSSQTDKFVHSVWTESAPTTL